MPLSFLDALSGRDNRKLAEQLYERGWCSRQQQPERSYELHVLVRQLLREAAELAEWEEKLQKLVHETYRGRETHFSLKDSWLDQCRHALQLWKVNQDPRQKDLVHAPFHDFCERRGHGALFVSLADQVLALFPDEKETQAVALNSKALILKAWGKLQEAMALHQKQQDLSEQLGEPAGLAICWWNMGHLYGKKGDRVRQKQLWQQAIQAREAIGIPVDQWLGWLAALPED